MYPFWIQATGKKSRVEYFLIFILRTFDTFLDAFCQPGPTSQSAYHSNVCMYLAQSWFKQAEVTASRMTVPLFWWHEWQCCHLMSKSKLLLHQIGSHSAGTIPEISTEYIRQNTATFTTLSLYHGLFIQFIWPFTMNEHSSTWWQGETLTCSKHDSTGFRSLREHRQHVPTPLTSHQWTDTYDSHCLEFYDYYCFSPSDKSR